MSLLAIKKLLTHILGASTFPGDGPKGLKGDFVMGALVELHIIKGPY